MLWKPKQTRENRGNNDDIIRNTVTEEVIRKWAPEIQFHFLERFLPMSMETMLKGAFRYQISGNGPSEEIPIQSPSDLAGLDSSWRLKLDPQHQIGSGNVEDAPMYVGIRIAEDDSYVELVYRFLFAYNGPQSLHVKLSNFNYTLPQLAEHDGDWEGCQIRLSPDLQECIGVITEAHGNVREYLRRECLWRDKTHVRLKSAVNSHGIYNTRKKTTNIVLEDLKVLDVIDAVTNKGPTWQPWKQPVENRPFRIIGRQWNNPKEVVDKREEWATFSGRMGTFRMNHIKAPCDANGGGLSRYQTGVAYAQMGAIQAAKKANLLPKDMFESWPSGGPGTRPEMQPFLPPLVSLNVLESYFIYSLVDDFVLSINEREEIILETKTKTETNKQKWYVLNQPKQNEYQFVNVSTKKIMAAPLHRGQQVYLVPRPTRSELTIWFFDNGTLRPIKDTFYGGLSLNAFGDYYVNGTSVGLWDTNYEAKNSLWNIQP